MVLTTLDKVCWEGGWPAQIHFFVMHNFFPRAFLLKVNTIDGHTDKMWYFFYYNVTFVNVFVTGLHLSLVIAFVCIATQNSVEWVIFSPFLFLISTNVTEVLLGVFLTCMLIGLTNVLHSPNSSMLNHGLFILVFYLKRKPTTYSSDICNDSLRVCWNIVDLQVRPQVVVKHFAAKMSS